MNERKEQSFRINPKLVRKVVPIFAGILLTGAEIIAANNVSATNNLNLQRQVYLPSVKLGEVIANPTFIPTPPAPCVYKDGQGFCGDMTPRATPTFPFPIERPTATATLTRVPESPTPLSPDCFIDANGNVICVINISMSPTPIATPTDPHCHFDSYGNEICVGDPVASSPVPSQ